LSIGVVFPQNLAGLAVHGGDPAASRLAKVLAYRAPGCLRSPSKIWNRRYSPLSNSRWANLPHGVDNSHPRVISRAFPLCAADGAGTDELQGFIHRNRVGNGVLVPALPMPPDPSTLAAKVDSAVAATIGDGTAFLYTWPNPVQTSVAPNTIIPTRAAVVRGKVLVKTNALLPDTECGG
jgi:hypothetical protein